MKDIRYNKNGGNLRDSDFVFTFWIISFVSFFYGVGVGVLGIYNFTTFG